MPLPPIHSRIKEAIENDTLVIFVGAGMSRAIDLPNWRELIGKFSQEISKDYPVAKFKKIPENLSDGSYDELHALGLLYDHKPTVLKILEKEIDVDLTSKDLNLHKKLWQITKKIVTTNYDYALEKADGVVKTYVYDNKFRMAQLAGKPEYLFKVHGCISRTDTCILFKEQFDKLYNAQHAAEFELRTILNSNTVLFIGFGMEDPYVNYVLHALKVMHHDLKEKHFWLSTDTKDLNEYGVEQIKINDYKTDLPARLDQLAKHRQAIVQAQEQEKKQLQLSQEQIEQLKKDKEELLASLEKTKEGDKLKAQAQEEIELGNYEEADQLLEQSSLDKAGEVAETLYERGKLAKLRLKYQEAFRFFELAVNLQPANAHFLNELGIIFVDLGQYDNAIGYYEKALEINQQAHGDESLEVATCFNNIGLAWDGKGQYDKAIAYFEKALEIDLIVYGDKHPSTAIDYNNLGGAWNSKGQYDKAIGYFEKALTIDLKALGNRHLNVSIRYNNLGGGWHSKGQYDRAIEYFEKALEINLKAKGDRHPKVAFLYNNLGMAWDSKGQYDRAIEHFEKALEISLKVYGDSHPEVAVHYNNLGMSWNSKGQCDRAIEYFEKTLEIYLKTHGYNHPDTAITFNNLGGAWICKGQYDRAIGYYEKAREIDFQVHGDKHPNLAIRYNNLGMVWNIKGQYTKALEYYEKALEIFRKFLDEEHPSIQTVKENLDVARKETNKNK